MTNTEQREHGFKAGVRAYHTTSPYALTQLVQELKSNAWGCRTPYIEGFLQGVSEPQPVPKP
jgi:hypothetical protein